MMEEQLVLRKIEFAQIKKKIEIIATFLPDYILNDPEIGTEPTPPFVGVVLEVCIFGMTKLIEKFNKYNTGSIYRLTFTLNAYLSVIVEAVTYWGGDVLKIYGDSILNLWKVSPDESLEEILHLVILCATTIQEGVENFSTILASKLKLKMSISCGNINVNVFGNEVKLLLLRGDAMEELSKVSQISKSGDICISSKAWSHAAQKRYEVLRINSDAVQIKSSKIVYQMHEQELQEYFVIKQFEARDVIQKHVEYLNNLLANPRIDTHKVVSELTEDFKQQIPERSSVSSSARECNLEMLSYFVWHRIQTSLDENQPVEYLTEITTLTVQVICVQPNSVRCISDAFIKLIYKEVASSIKKSSLFIYKFEVHSSIKIIILSECSGMQQDVESQKALRCGYMLSQRFQNIPGVDWASVGIFHGYFYCGVLGHPCRRDYVVLGSLINRGFYAIDRHKGKVLCDYRTFQFSKLSSFYFRCIGEKKCRRTYDKNQLLEYDENIQVSEKRSIDISNRIFGRDQEIEVIDQMLHSDDSSGLGVIIEAENKLGKSALIQHVLDYASESGCFAVASLKVLEICTSPFFTVNKLYRQLYYDNMRYYGRSIMQTSLPIELIDTYIESEADVDYALMKYRILNNFRDMVEFGSDRITLLAIDNIQDIDPTSWDILDIVIQTCRVRFLGSGYFESNFTDISYEIRKNDRITFLKLDRLDDHWINSIACQLLHVAALSRQLSELICETCKGQSGYVEYCLMYFVSSEQPSIRYILKENMSADYVPIDEKVFATLPNRIAVMGIRDHFGDDKENVKITVDSITNEFYISLSPFERNILMTSSVLGDLFTRTLLVCALHYPDHQQLENGLKILFERNIFDCGSNFVSGYPIGFSTKIRCRCYFDENERSEMKGEKYKYCKLLHFRNENIKDLAYGLIPMNQKKDLHLLCTDVLEHTLQLCPRCLRDPSNSFLSVAKYNEITEFCESDHFDATKCEPAAIDNLKDCVRRTMKSTPLYHNTSDRNLIEEMREIFDSTQCHCFEIFIYIYKQLIYHSTNANHLGKRIFFFTTYGLLLILAKDVLQAIAVLREAHELSMINIPSVKVEISPSFRKYHVCKISRGIATAFLTLRQVKQAKNQMSIALRQYNIPSLVFNYTHFQLLLRRYYLRTSIRCQHPSKLKYAWMNWELGLSLILCAKIYAIEGNYNYAKYCSSYSIWLLAQENDRVPMLFDAYCNAIELHRYGLDKDVCEKLQKYVTKEVLLNYCNNNGMQARHLMYLLCTTFELKLARGKLNEAIRMCYRIIDFTMKIYIFITQYDIIIWTDLLFIYAMRVREYHDLMRVIHRNIRQDSVVWFYANALNFALLTGYSIVSIDILTKEIYSYLNYRRQDRINWDKTYLLSLIHLHLVKIDRFLSADKYKPSCPLNSTTLKRPIVLRILFNLIEATLTEICYKLRKNGSYSRLESVVNKHLDLAKAHVKNMPVFYPRYYCLLAWKFRLCGLTKKWKKTLRKAESNSWKHGNIYHLCLVRQLRYHWLGNALPFVYKKRINDLIGESKYFNEDQWSQNLPPFPVP